MNINRLTCLISAICLSFFCLLTIAHPAEATQYQDCAITVEEQREGYRCPVQLSFDEVALAVVPVNNFAWSGISIRMNAGFLNREAGEEIESIRIVGKGQWYASCAKRFTNSSSYLPFSIDEQVDAWIINNRVLQARSVQPPNAHRWLGVNRVSEQASIHLKSSHCRHGWKGSYSWVEIETDKRLISLVGSQRFRSVELVSLKQIRSQIVDLRLRTLKRHRLRLSINLQSDKKACLRNRTVIVATRGFKRVLLRTRAGKGRLTLPTLPLKSPHFVIRVKREWRNGYLCQGSKESITWNPYIYERGRGDRPRSALNN